MIRKIGLFLVLLLLSCVLFGFNSNHVPSQIIITDIETKTEINNIIKHVNESNYEKAMESLEKISSQSTVLITQYNDVFNNLLSNYKKILINKATKHINNNELVKASVLLNSKIKYYENDAGLQNILQKTANKLKNKNNLTYDAQPEIFYFKNVLAYPNVALNPKNYNYNEFNEQHLTPTEFKKILHYLYSENYVLINASMLYNITKGQPQTQNIIVPKGKKPIVLLLDHVSYPNNPGSLADKTIVDRNRKIATYTAKKSINERVSYNKEFTTILENFISANPQFSYNNSRATICFNGSNGVLGYKTFRNNVAFKSEVKKVRKVIQKLKSLGYEFASSGYSTQNLTKQTHDEFLNDIEKWNKEVGTIIQKTPLYNACNNSEQSLMAFGEHMNILKDNGFLIILYNANNMINAEKSIVNINKQNFLLLPYKVVDGNALRDKNNYVYDVLKHYDIYDNEFRS